MKRTLLLTILVCALTPSAGAQISPFSTVQRVSVVHTIRDGTSNIQDGTSNTIASLGRARDGSVALIVRTFDRSTGFQRRSALIATPNELGISNAVDVLVSTVFEPGSVLVLDNSRRVSIVPLSVLGDGSVRLAAPPTLIGPIGSEDLGLGTVISEVPNRANTDEPFLALGTNRNKVVIATRIGLLLPATGSLPITSSGVDDLVAIPQVGYIALGALAGGKLFLLNPDDDPATPGLQPRVKADVRDSNRIWIDINAPALDRDSLPLSIPAALRFVTADGTTDVVTYELPTNPTLNGVLSPRIVESVGVPVKQVVLGSLSWLPTDGAGILYNRNFTVDSGLVGRVWTIAGASMDLDPETLNLRSRGRHVTAIIEVENQRATEIIVSSLKLSVYGAEGRVHASLHPAAELEDVDGDTNLDLKVKFDRRELVDLARQIRGDSCIVRAHWRYTDGSKGSASTEISLRR